MPDRYYTFAPGKAPKNRRGDEIHLRAGETLHFQQGRGYYASATGADSRPTPPRYGYAPGNTVYNTAPRYVAPRRPVAPRKPIPADPMAGLTPAQIDARANAIAQGNLTPQENEIRRQQAEAARQEAAREAAIQGFTTAAAGMEGAIAPQVSDAYHTATQDVGALGQGMATGVADTIAGEQKADAALAASQGQSGGSSIDSAGLHDSVFALNGLVPGTSLAEQGAAATRQAAGIPQIQLNAGREELQSAMADARAKNDDFAQQLIQVAAQFPDQKRQALQMLNQYEMDKAQYREQVRMNNEQQRSNRESERQAQQNFELQDRAERASEAAAGLDRQAKVQADAADYTYKMASLAFKNKKDADAAKAKGKVIDVAASKLLGYVVYKDGSSNKGIPVKKGGTGSGSKGSGTPVHRKNVAVQKASSTAYTYATTLHGAPLTARKTGYRPPQGRYQARAGVKGAFPDGTTNDPNKAARQGGAKNYAEAQQMVWGKIAGDQLMAQYGLSKEQVMSIVNRALKRAGWKRGKKKKMDEFGPTNPLLPPDFGP